MTIILHRDAHAAFYGVANDLPRHQSPHSMMRFLLAEIDPIEGPCAWIVSPLPWLRDYAHAQDDLGQAHRFALNDLRNALYDMQIVRMNGSSIDHDFLAGTINRLSVLQGPPTPPRNHPNPHLA